MKEKTKDSDKICNKGMNTLLYSTSDMIFIKDINLVYLSASKAFVNMTGWQEAEEIIGKTDMDIFADKDLARRYIADDKKLLEKGEDLHEYIEPITEKNGNPRYSSTSKYILRDNNNEPIGLLGIGKDITKEYLARLDYEQELNVLFKLPEDTIAAILFDITDWRVVDTRTHKEGAEIVSIYLSAREYFEAAANAVVSDDNVRSFLHSFTQQAANKAYANGKRFDSIEYLRCLPDGSYRVVRDEFHYMIDPVNRHLNLMVILRDVEEEKIKQNSQDIVERKFAEQLIKELVVQNFDFVSLIDVNTECFTVSRSNEEIKNIVKIEAGQKYSDILYKAATKMATGRRREVLFEGLSFSNMLKSIHKDGSYVFSFPVKTPEGNVLPKEWRASWFNDKHDSILFIKRDITTLYEAERDELTGLLNRHGFCRQARELINKHHDITFELICFDIDRFKIYNDTFGTHSGDKLLREISRIKESVNYSNGLYARLESDHFAILLPYSKGTPELIHNIIQNWLTVQPCNLKLTTSFGVYLINDRTIDVNLMCDRAIMALRSVKSSYSDKIAYFDENMRGVILAEQELVNDMETALKQNQFKVYFQPLINYNNNTIIGAEALVRWQHPKKGLIMPSDFITVFEKNGFIARMDEYVWEQVCIILSGWKDAGLSTLPISINISRHEIYSLDLGNHLTSLIEKYNLQPSMLRLEITESSYMQDPTQLISFVTDIKKRGFSVEMDDFGSGYSSLNTLKEVHVDTLKLDMKFIEAGQDDTRAEKILNSIVRMADWLDCSVIAEGVETKEQADYLRSLGCVHMQGFYFSRPMPSDEYEILLKNSKRDM